MSREPEHPWFAGLPEHYVVAHRGAAGHRPENTLESFRHALELGADVLEMDVHLTADGHLVVTHDLTVARVTEAGDPVSSYPLRALQALDAGHRFTADQGATFPWRAQGVRIPTLLEVLAEFPDTRFVIEIKPKSRAVTSALAELLTKQDLRHRILVGSFHDSLLRHLRVHAPGYATGAGVAESKRLVVRAHFGLARRMELPYEALIVPRTHRRLPVITPRVVRQARALGLHVQVWTVNDPTIMQQLYAMNVHAITTDYPDRARAVLREMHA